MSPYVGAQNLAPVQALPEESAAEAALRAAEVWALRFVRRHFQQQIVVFRPINVPQLVYLSGKAFELF